MRSPTLRPAFLISLVLTSRVCWVSQANISVQHLTETEFAEL